LNDLYVSVCVYQGTKQGYLVLAGVGRGVPGDQVSIPKVKLYPLCTPTKMQRVARACHVAIGLRGRRSSIGSNIRKIAAV
jgi:hypothetical protein